jgi:hypothetical protein
MYISALLPRRMRRPLGTTLALLAFGISADWMQTTSETSAILHGSFSTRPAWTCRTSTHGSKSFDVQSVEYCRWIRFVCHTTDTQSVGQGPCLCVGQPACGVVLCHICYIHHCWIRAQPTADTRNPLVESANPLEVCWPRPCPHCRFPKVILRSATPPWVNNCFSSQRKSMKNSFLFLVGCCGDYRESAEYIRVCVSERTLGPGLWCASHCGSPDRL